MNSADHAEFSESLGNLCAGFNVPCTAERQNAYFIGLTKMQMPAFVRCVEHALGDEGPEKIPTVSQLWLIYRKLHKRVSNAPAHQQTAVVERDPIIRFANRCLYVYLRKRVGVDEQSLKQLITAKNRIAKAFITGGFDDGEDKASVMREKMEQAFSRMTVAPMTAAESMRHQECYCRTGHAANFAVEQ